MAKIMLTGILEVLFSLVLNQGSQAKYAMTDYQVLVFVCCLIICYLITWVSIP